MRKCPPFITTASPADRYTPHTRDQTETPGSPRNSLHFAEEMKDFLMAIGGKIAPGLVTLAVIAAGISWYGMDPATRHMLVLGTGRLFAWFGIMLVLPWATFYLIGRVGRMGSNIAGG